MSKSLQQELIAALQAQDDASRAFNTMTATNSACLALAEKADDLRRAVLARAAAEPPAVIPTPLQTLAAWADASDAFCKHLWSHCPECDEAQEENDREYLCAEGKRLDDAKAGASLAARKVVRVLQQAQADDWQGMVGIAEGQEPTAEATGDTETSAATGERLTARSAYAVTEEANGHDQS